MNFATNSSASSFAREAELAAQIPVRVKVEMQAATSIRVFQPHWLIMAIPVNEQRMQTDNVQPLRDGMKVTSLNPEMRLLAKTLQIVLKQWNFHRLIDGAPGLSRLHHTHFGPTNEKAECFHWASEPGARRFEYRITARSNEAFGCQTLAWLFK